MQLSTDRTTVIVLAAPIAENGVDRGSPQISAKTVDGLSNVVKVKATSDSLRPTNLTIFTKDGRVYRFAVEFSRNPACDFFDFSDLPTQATSDGAHFRHDRINDDAVSKTAGFVSDLPPTRSRPRSRRLGQTQLKIHGVYLSGNVLFFQFGISNKSGVPFTIDLVRSYQKDRKKSKRTSQMEKQMSPLAISFAGNPTINGNDRPYFFVLAFDRFTIADSKFFMVEVAERNGDRHLVLKLRGTDILRAKALLTR